LLTTESTEATEKDWKQNSFLSLLWALWLNENFLKSVLICGLKTLSYFVLSVVFVVKIAEGRLQNERGRVSHGDAEALRGFS